MRNYPHFLLCKTVFLSKFFNAAQHRKFDVFVGQTALHVSDIWRFDRSVRRQFQGGAAHKSACRHNDLLAITGHIPRLGADVGVNGRNGLNDPAKTDQFVSVFKEDGADDVAATFTAFRKGSVTKLSKGAAKQQTAFQGAGYDVRRQE